MKEKYFWVAIVVVVIAWIGNYTYLKSQQLDKPIILSHYYELEQADRTDIRIFYLTNKNHQALQRAQINGMDAYWRDDQGFSMYDQPIQPQVVQEFRHHYLKSAVLEVAGDMLPLKKGSGDIWSTNELSPTFIDSGQTVQLKPTELGMVSIIAGYPNKQAFLLTGNSGNNRTYVTKEALKPVVIDEINLPFKEQLKEHMNIKVDLNQNQVYQSSWNRISWNEVPGKELKEVTFPIHLKKRDNMSVYVQLDDQLKSYVHLSLKLKGKTTDGDQFITPVSIYSHPYFTQKDIDEIISDKGRGR
ncbi:hypothetical protein [Pseudalkalibacillus berkeleyi]|uniref:DUF4340 domain-containing protein n=1 Tax=Pseudalkalibacillus berkeleyi TaxID=1069813 RepID=A0ABS9GU75_9BACL|nr:hypothetical protein [Pseudalkalibacillus berkeleyi]MCF6136392.1 hypothetical protein [Pseudalkalibacillus berkeleyi]